MSTKMIVILYIIINVVFANRALLSVVISNIFGSIPYVAGKINSYIESSNEEGAGRVISLGFIIFLHSLFYCVSTKTKFTRQKMEN